MSAPYLFIISLSAGLNRRYNLELMAVLLKADTAEKWGL
jgi:hypothetical protein